METQTQTKREPVIVFAWAMETIGRNIICACTPEEAPGKLAGYLEEAKAKGYTMTDEHKEAPTAKAGAGLPLPFHIIHAQHLGNILQLELYYL